MSKKQEQKPVKENIRLQQITQTLEINYMPYAMSVIISRAIPEIDGFKPSHRKLLYTMYKMGLLSGGRMKSANIVGQTMKLNPHGDAAIYETMVRLTRGYQALLHPFVDSKGSFGKTYSRDMAYAASRYTEAKLEKICELIFGDIDKDTVDFVDNYDSTMQEPTLLPTAFPNILVNPNQGIAVGMASSICSFNLAEVCRTTIELIKNPDHDVASTLLAPDFSTGGQLIADQKALEEIYQTGRGSIKVRSKYNYDKKNNCIEVTEIPYSTTVEAIMEKIIELNKAGKLREISDVRDETDLSGLKFTIDLKRGADPDRLMAALFRCTPLEDSVSCNFNVLIGGVPMVLGVKDILTEWTAFRVECVKRRVHYSMTKKKDRLHLLYGLRKILLDIDKAIKIIRGTEDDAEVVPNLMIGFGIDEKQAEFIAEIKLRNLNKQYILNALNDVEKLEKEIADLEDILRSRKRVDKIIISELEDAIKRFGKPRLTEIIYRDELDEPEPEQTVDDYPVTAFLTREGYFKKITPQSLRMSSEQRLKDGDEIAQSVECSNACSVLVFTDRAQVYKSYLYEFDDTKASVLGDFLPAKLSMDEGESPVAMAVTADYSGYMLFAFGNGRAAKVPLSSYRTKTNRKKLTSAFCAKFPLTAALQLDEDGEIAFIASNGKVLVFHSGSVPEKAARDTQGIIVMKLPSKHRLERAVPAEKSGLVNPAAYRARGLPASGAAVKKEDGDLNQTRLM